MYKNPVSPNYQSQKRVPYRDAPSQLSLLEQVEKVNGFDKFKYGAKREAIMATNGAVGFDASSQMNNHYEQWRLGKEKEYYKIAKKRIFSELEKAY